MKPNFKNIVKCVIFYSCVIMGCLSLAINWEESSSEAMIWWFMILSVLGAATYKICAGKSAAELKEFIGVNLEEE
jgi:hypothetical protein